MHFQSRQLNENSFITIFSEHIDNEPIFRRFWEPKLFDDVAGNKWTLTFKPVQPIMQHEDQQQDLCNGNRE